jgi:hypothetical protein
MSSYGLKRITMGAIGVCLLCVQSRALSQQLNILVIGSTRSFSEGNESGVLPQKPYNPAGIAAHLQGILAQDSAITENVHVEFEDIYKTKTQTVNYSGSNIYDFTSHCYSLAQHYFWPDGKSARLAKLRGEGTHVWDYIVLCQDPYIMANFPGMVAEGVKLIQSEVLKSAHPAQLVLLAQWPENSSTFTANQFNEISHRVGNSAGLAVVPAGKAWSSFTSQDTSTSHPTPRGEYLAAAAVYSKLFNRSASTSGYDYPVVGDAIADHARSVVQANAGTSQYTGAYTVFNPFQMKYLTKRTVQYRETGTSTEDRIADALGRLDDVLRITFGTAGYAGVPGTRWDFNYGRGNDWWEDDKDYEVDQNKYDWVYGFPMHHYYTNSSPLTMPYGIDKHYYFGSTYEDGTDLGIPYNMIRPGTREPDWPDAVRAVPIRLMWQKMSEASPGFNPLGDNTHMGTHLNDATAAFMYTLLSGRCPIVPEPTPQGSANAAWMQWLGHKVGYETAWQMSHLSTRAPGFRVLPASASATSVTPTTTTTLTVQFMNPPQSDVTVNVSVSNAAAAIVGPKTLVFTPSNYQTPQQVTVAGIPGASASPTFNVVFNTTSNDEIFHGLSDSWAYTNNRSATSGLTQVNNGITAISTTQATPVSINLNPSNANSGNTILLAPTKGSVTWTATGVIQYIPMAGYLGKDEISYATTMGGTQTIGTFDITVGVLEGQVNVSSGDSNASETAPNNSTYIITRSGATGNALNVFFNMSGTVTIPSGQSSVTITLTPLDDSVLAEGRETAVLTVMADAAYPIGTASAAVTIDDNDNILPVVNAGADQSVAIISSAPWLPVSLNPQAWYDASDASTVISAGGLVSEWRDKTTNNRHATQPTGSNQPATGTNTMGGRNVISLNGSNQFFNVNLDYLANVTHSAFIVTRTTVFGNIYGAATSGSGASSLHVGFANNTQYRMNLWGNDWNGSIGSAFNASSGNVLNYIWTPGVSKQIFANGSSQGSSTNAGNISTMAGGGRFGNVVGQSLYGGNLAEMVFITGNVSAADRERMEGYLAHKWGLAGNLPTAHPHKNTPPGGPAAVATLDGTVTDTDPFTTTWSVVSGPGSVNFGSASAIDTTATFSVVGSYVLRLTANDGFSQVHDDITIVVYDPQTFAGWMNGFANLGGLTGFNDDADGDGVKNGMEAFFGSAPNVSNSGLSPISSGPNSLTFTHPQANPPLTDVTGFYEWSLDLTNWHASGSPSGGTTVTISAVQNTPQTGTTSVTATVDGTNTGKIFLRAVAKQP